MTRDDLVAYIKGFDQRTRILIGIFEKSTGLLLGFLRNDVNFETNQFLALVNSAERKRGRPPC